MNFILIPGPWMGAWGWDPVTHGLRALGHHVYPVTLSGLAKNGDISDVGLATHVEAVLALAGGDNAVGLLIPRMADSLRKHECTNVAIEVIKNSGHWVIDEQPEVVAGLIERYASL